MQNRSSDANNQTKSAALAAAGLGASIGTGVGVGLAALLGIVNLMNRGGPQKPLHILRMAAIMGLVGAGTGYGVGYAGTKSVDWYFRRKARQQNMIFQHTHSAKQTDAVQTAEEKGSSLKQ